MCLAIPGKVLEVHGKEAVVDFGGVMRGVRVDLVDAKVGDYVIVHTGCAIQIMSEEDALESIKMLEEILNAE